MVESVPPVRTPVNGDDEPDVGNLPKLLKELDDATGVADGVESKLDVLMAQIEALENSLERQLESAGVRPEAIVSPAESPSADDQKSKHASKSGP